MIGSYQAAGSLFPEMGWLQQQLEEMLQPPGASGIRSLAGRAFPAINVGTTADSVEVIAFLPGLDPKEIDIRVERGLLSIAGAREGQAVAREGESGKRETGTNVYARERFAGRFRRVIGLPEDADPAKVEATFRDGILKVSVAKLESSKPRQITVN